MFDSEGGARTEVRGYAEASNPSSARWQVGCSCGWSDPGYTDVDQARTAALIHRLALHADEVTL